VGFGGGLNLRDPSNALDLDELSEADNVFVSDERGSLSARPGCRMMGLLPGSTGNERVLSMWRFDRGAAGPHILYHTSAGKLLYSANGGATITAIASNVSTSQPMSFETFNNKCYMSNGTDSYCSWDGTTYTTYPSAPKGKYLRLWRDAMWVSGIPGSPDRVYESNPGDAETFGVASWVDIAKGDGDRVTTLATDGNFLIVAKRDRIWVITDPVTFFNRLVDYEKGSESHFSWVACAGVLYFLSRYGIFAFLPDQPSVPISGKLDPIFNDSIINYGALESVTAYNFRDRVGWTLPEAGSSITTFQIEFSPKLPKAPWTTHRMPVRCFAVWRSGGTVILTAGSNNSNRVLQVFDTTAGDDDGTVFACQATTGWFALDLEDLIKYLRRIGIVARGSLYVALRKDFEYATAKLHAIDATAGGTDLWTTSDNWNEGVWGPVGSLADLTINTDLYFREIAVSFRDLGSSGAGAQPPIDIAGKSYTLGGGRWAVHEIQLHGMVMGPSR
jgi:hypothetical protein